MNFPSEFRFRRLFEAEYAAIDTAGRMVASLSRDGIELFEETDRVYSAVIERSKYLTSEAEALDSLQNAAAVLGLSSAELANRLRSDPAGLPPDCVSAWRRFVACSAIRTVLLACRRFWLWGAADLVRFRLSQASGYLRLEAECVGLAKLFADDPEKAHRWLLINNQGDGQAFFRETQPQVKAVLEEYELTRAYDFASGVAQHVRLTGMVRSLSLTTSKIVLPDHDVDLEDPFNFHLTVATFLKNQGRVLRAWSAVVQAKGRDHTTVFNGYAARVNALWSALEDRYTDRITDLVGEGGG